MLIDPNNSNAKYRFDRDINADNIRVIIISILIEFLE